MSELDQHMANFNVAKAVRSNSVYARHLRWISKYERILVALGFSTPPSTAPQFAEAVADWQDREGLKGDGMLGPNTWRKLKAELTSSSLTALVPHWLTTRPIEEGWFDCVLLTLRRDCATLRCSHGVHSVTPRDFKNIADKIEAGDIILVTESRKGGAYEFRNTEADANTIKLPRRSKHGWRHSQALIVHEVCHALSDLRGESIATIDEEAFAYVVQRMFAIKWRAPNVRRSSETMRIYDAADALAIRYLLSRTPPRTMWNNLKDAIRAHSVYKVLLARFPVSDFDGL